MFEHKIFMFFMFLQQKNYLFFKEKFKAR